MGKQINGKQVKITKAGYLYVDGVKVSGMSLTPISGPDITDPDISEYARKWVNRNWQMCDPSEVR